MVAAFGLGLALTHRPGWYRPQGIDRARLHADKLAMADLQEQISAALNQGRPVRFRLEEDQLNRWIAARAEMWPEAAIDLGGLERPQAVLSEKGIRLGATVKRASLEAVITLNCRLELGEEYLTVRYDTPRAGAIPLPRSWLMDLLVELPGVEPAALRSLRPGTIRVRNELVWPNGKRRCRLRELTPLPGAIEVVLEPVAGR